MADANEGVDVDAMETAVQEDEDAAELSSGGSSGEEEEGEAVSSEVLQKMEEIKATLSTNPYHYDSHVQLVSLARSAGDLDAARKAREAMHKVYPLTEALWLEWLRDELPLAELEEAVGDIRALFEKAVDDYIAPGVWLMYAQFAVERMDKFEEGIAFPRDVFERSITASGLHTSKGSLLWDAYREFEMAVLSSLQAMQPEEGPDEELTKRIQAQYDVVDSIFKRQLAVPLIGMQSTFREYQEWCDEEVKNSLPSYSLALKKLKELEQFERDLSTSTPPSLDVYREYIAHELKGKDLARISCIYMRALADHCLDVELWKEYLKYLDSSLKVRDTVLQAHHQSIRNCPWAVDMWVSYVRAMERLQCSHEELVAAFEESLSGNFVECRDYVQMWLAYCGYLHRRIRDWNSADSADIKELAETFKRAKDNLKEYFGSSGDQDFVLARFQAQIEAGCRGNMDRARQLWDEIIRSHAGKAEFQLQYVSLERCYGDESRCRLLLKRAVDSVQDLPDLVFGVYLSFEREKGTLDSLVAAEERVEARRAQLRRRAEKEKQMNLDKAAWHKQKGKSGRGGERESEGKRGKVQAEEKEGRVRASPSTESGRKRRHHQVFLQDDDEEVPDVEAATSLATPTEDQHSEPLVKKPKLQEAPAIEDVVRPPANEQDHPPEEPTGQAPSDGRADNVTVFVSNLPFGTKTSEIQSLFVTCGDIVDIRTVRSAAKGKARKPFAFAYVQFSTEDAMQKALMHDRVSFHGRQVYVSQCSGDRKQQGTDAPVSRFPGGRQKETVFVSNLPFSMDEEHVKSVFSKCGEVRQVRLVTFSKGRRKGIAYVEYLDEQSAQKAVEELDQHEVDGRKITVAISNPPKRDKRDGAIVAMETKSSKTAPQRDMPPPSLVPSSISRRSRIHIGARGGKYGSSQAGGGGKAEQGEEKKRLSNEDFRKLFAPK